MTLCQNDTVQKGKYKAAVRDVLQKTDVLAFNSAGTACTSFPLAFAFPSFGAITDFCHCLLSACSLVLFLYSLIHIQLSFFLSLLFWGTL